MNITLGEQNTYFLITCQSEVLKSGALRGSKCWIKEKLIKFSTLSIFLVRLVWHSIAVTYHPIVTQIISSTATAALFLLLLLPLLLLLTLLLLLFLLPLLLLLLLIFLLLLLLLPFHG